MTHPLGQKDGKLGQKDGKLGQKDGKLGQKDGKLGQKDGKLGQRGGKLGDADPGDGFISDCKIILSSTLSRMHHDVLNRRRGIMNSILMEGVCWMAPY